MWSAATITITQFHILTTNPISQLTTKTIYYIDSGIIEQSKHNKRSCNRIDLIVAIISYQNRQNCYVKCIDCAILHPMFRGCQSKQAIRKCHIQKKTILNNSQSVYWHEKGGVICFIFRQRNNNRTVSYRIVSFLHNILILSILF